MKDFVLREAANEYYIENVMGEPLTEKVPIECFIKGAEFIQIENKKNYRLAIKNLEPIRNSLIEMNLHSEWFKIVNALRLSAGMELMDFKKKM